MTETNIEAGVSAGAEPNPSRDRSAAVADARTRTPERPYAPSWANRMAAWVDRLPIPRFLFYLLLAVTSTMLLMGLKWLDGTVPVGSFDYVYVLSAITGIYTLAGLHYLDQWAAEALRKFRVVLAVDESGFEQILYRLTTMPGRGVTIAAIVGFVYGAIGIIGYGSATLNANGTQVSAADAVVQSIDFILSYLLAAVLVYHTIHQLRLVNEIYTKHTRINLFQPGPLYTLSNLAARTAFLLSIPTFLWFQVNSSSQGSTGESLAESAVFAAVIVLTFIWPLVGAHNLLAREKERLKSEAASRIEGTIAELHRRIDSGDLRDVNTFKQTLDVLAAEQGVINNLRTWPWQTQTVSGLSVAVLLPMMIWLLQRVLARLGI